ncbi:MAG: nitrogenase component 1 [Clostridium sp.]
MARKKINLNVTNVEVRETRLGTIVNWNGSAKDLVKASQYEARGKGEKRKCGSGEGCRLCASAGPFSQATTCSSKMVSCQAGMVVDAVLIQHSSIGCAVDATNYTTTYRVGLKLRGYKVEDIRTVTTNLLEKDMVFGATDKLKQTIKDVWERLQPKVIFIGNSCATAIIGEDIESAAREAEEKYKIPVVPLSCEGFRAAHWTTGFDAVQHGILRQVVNKHPKKQEDLVNVINLFGSDVFTPIFKELNLRVNFAVDLATVDNLRQLSEAACTTTFCYTLSSYIAAGLEQEYGVKEIKSKQPYGFSGTDEWLREIAKATDRVDLTEKYIEKEHKRVEKEVEKYRKKFKGIKAIVATGSAYAHGLVTVLRELGIEVDGTLVFHHDPVYDSGDVRQDTLRTLVDETGDIKNFTVANRQQFAFASLIKKTNPDFVIVRHTGLAPLAAKLGVPGVAIGDENKSIGYQGLLNIAETVEAVMQRRKFNDDLRKHADLPYTDWWLQQEDSLILSKHPEILEEI